MPYLAPNHHQVWRRVLDFNPTPTEFFLSKHFEIEKNKIFVRGQRNLHKKDEKESEVRWTGWKVTDYAQSSSS